MSRHPVFDILLFVVAALGTASCNASQDVAPEIPIKAEKSNTRPYEALSLALGSVKVTRPSLSGTLGPQPVTAARTNDSTLSLVMPPVAPGSYQLRLENDGSVLVADIAVAPPNTVSDAAAVTDSVALSAEATAQMVESSLAALAGRGTDTAAVHHQVATLRTQIAHWKSALAAASPEERRQVAAFFAANPQLSVQSFVAGGGVNAGGGDVSACTAGASCMSDFEKTVRRFIVGMSVLAGGMIAVKSASWLVGVAGKITTEGISIAAAGVTLGYVFVGISEMVSTPIAPTVTAESPSPSLSASVAEAAGGTIAATLVNGKPGALTVTAQYASLTASDLATNPAATSLGKAVSSLQDVWRTIASAVPFIELPVPTFPPTPARKVEAAIPADQLSLVGATPAGFGATASVQGTSWMVTVANDKQGEDHDVTLAVRFTPPGFAPQTTTRTVLVRPQQYAAASITLTPPSAQLLLGATASIPAVVRDTSGDVLTTSMLGSAPLKWTSGDAAVATVDASGVVTGISSGVAAITAASGDKQAQVNVTVANVTVTISPRTATGAIASTTQFAATVSGALNTGVTWKATGGTVSSTGAFSSTAAGSFKVIAQSVASPLRADTATITISSAVDSVAVYRAAVAGTWKLEWTYASDGRHALTENLVLRSDFTGYEASSVSENGTVSTATSETQTPLSYSISRNANGRYVLTIAVRGLAHGGLLTYPLTPISGTMAGGGYNTLLSKN